jgi:hypothetical protein
MVVHGPKFALASGGFGSFGGVLGMGIDIATGKVAKDKAQLIAQAF